MGLFTPKSGNFASLKVAGNRVAGTITSQPTTRQVVDYMTKMPATLKDGSPKMGILINLRDAQGVDTTLDTGGKWRMERAISDALLAAGITTGDLEIGGHLTVEVTGTEPGKGQNPALTFRAEYVKAADNAQQAAPAAQQQGYVDPNAGYSQQGYPQADQGGYPAGAAQQAQGGQPMPYQQPVTPPQGYPQQAQQAPQGYANTPNPWG